MKANVFFSDALKKDNVVGKLAMLTLFGELDNLDGDKVFRKIDVFYKKNPHIKGFIFDFGEVENLNSKAIGSLMNLNVRVQKQGGKIIIARPLSKIQTLFNEVGVDRKIETCSGLEEARSLLKEALED